MQLAALILTGGRSKRMGRPKEFLPFCGDTLLGRTAGSLQRCCDPVLVIRRNGKQELPALPANTVVIEDELHDTGPLAAVAAGLRHLRDARGFGPDDAAFVTGCDSPFPDPRAVRAIANHLDGVDAVVPLIDDTLQPLCAIYRAGTLQAADDLLSCGVTALRSLAEKVRTRTLDEVELRGLDVALRFLINVNTAAEYARALTEAERDIP